MDEYLLQTGKYLAQAGSNINDANKLLKTNQKQMENIQKKYHKIWAYIDAEAKSVEEEISDLVRKELQKNLAPSWKIYEPFDAQYAPNFKHISFHDRNEHITEFDGLFIMSDDQDFEMVYRDDYENVASKYRMVIIEAKHNLKVAHIRTKIEQIKKIQQLFEFAKSLQQGDAIPCTPLFKQMVKAYKLYAFSPDITLYFGGPNLDRSVVDFIKNEASDYQGAHITVHIVQPSGNRYNIRRSENSYEPRNTTFIGGKKKKKTK